MKKLVAYLTSCFPEKEFSVELAEVLSQNGVDMLELGIPFSDPVADGPVIEKANLKALQNGFKMSDLYDISKVISNSIDTLWMGYFNMFYNVGFDKICDIAKECGVSAFIIPDLPHEEALTYKDKFTLIDFVAPTDDEKRIEKVIKESEKFIYLVAYAGITGSKKSEDLSSVVESIRRYSNTPVYVGFGVNEKSAKQKAKGVDGVIVGSAFVEVLLDKDLTYKEKSSKIAQIARNIKDAINS